MRLYKPAYEYPTPIWGAAVPVIASTNGGWGSQIMVSRVIVRTVPGVPGVKKRKLATRTYKHASV